MRLVLRAIRHCLLLTMPLCLVMASSARAESADGATGEQIYKSRCASCHGTHGEGTEENYPQPLSGERSASQLARFIAKSMPKGAAKKCTAAEAGKVAAFIYEAFYSKAAQTGNQPPRIELSRLTVRQYRNAVTDLLGSFRSPARWDGPHGLRGEYFKTKRFRDDDRVLERIDPDVRFDFGFAGPVPSKFDDKEFSIRWEGSVLAPETGEYEFIVRTEHAARLWINSTKRLLIDAWVKSGNDNEYRASIFLLGGRVYPLRLEFSKAKQGVDDSKDKKAKRPPVKASIALEWKLPQRVAEVIPQRNLSPSLGPELFVLTTPFPPDDRSMGYERGTSVSRAWDRATTDAAIEVAGYVATHVNELAGVRDDPGDRAQRLRDFCSRFAERAFRRPLAPDQRRLYIDRQFEHAGDLEASVRRVILLVLKSPRFLYEQATDSDDGYDSASRLSFALWDSLPDRQLIDAAAAGKLATPTQVAQQAERMLSDLRAHSKLREFFFQWLKVDPPPDLSKDPKRFPGFDAAIASDLRTSLDLFLDDVLWSQSADFRQLLRADYLFLNGRLARFYGADLPAAAPFQKVRLNPEQRAGVLSHPYLMATFAYTSTSSPIHRGVFLARNVLGQVLRPPPEAFTPLPPDLHPNLTTRERVVLQTTPQMCQSCHSMINPLGFTLEHFDAVGRFQDREKDKPIDAGGSYLTRSGERVRFSGVPDLAKFLANSAETQQTFVERLFHYLVKQPIRAFGSGEAAELRQFFAQHDCNIRKLIVEIAAASALASARKSGQEP